MPQSVIGVINQWEQSNLEIFPPSAIYNVLVGTNLNTSGFKFLVVGNSKMEGNLEITGTLSATIDNIKVEDKDDNVNYQMIFINSSGNQIPIYTNAQLTYNPALDRLSASTFVGDLVGRVEIGDIGAGTPPNHNYSIVMAYSPSPLNALLADTSFTFNPSTETLTATSFSGDGSNITNLTIANLNGTIPNSKLSNDNITIGSTSIDLGATTTTLAGLTSISSVGYSGGLEFISLDIQPNIDFLIACSEGIGTAKFIASRTGFKFNPSTDLLTCPNFSGDGSLLTNLTIANLNGTIPNSKLTNDNITIGSTSIDLGATSTTLAGLTSVTSTNFFGYCDGLDLGTFTGTKRFVFASGSLPGANDVFSTSTSDICWDNTNKNIGIGNDSPDSTLSVNKFFSGGSGINLDNAISVQTTGDLPTNQYAFGLYTGSNTNTGNSYLQSGILDYRVGNNRNTANYNLLLQPLSGNVGIGNINPTYKLQVIGDIKCGNPSNNLTALETSTTSSFSYGIYIGGWSAGGRLAGHSTIEVSYNLHIDSPISGTFGAGDIYLNYYNSGRSTYIRNRIDISDRRIKKDIVKIESPEQFNETFEIIKKVGSYKYKYRDTYRENNIDQYGFIAQEVLKYYPVACKSAGDNCYLPNIMKTVNFTYEVGDDNQYTFAIEGYDLDVNIKYLFYAFREGVQQFDYLENIEPESNNVFKHTPPVVKNEEPPVYVKLVLVGTYTDDKLGVNKDKLFQLSFSGIIGLINENENMKKEIDLLKNELNLIKQHLNL